MPEVIVVFNDRTPQAKQKIRDAVLAAQKAHFEEVLQPQVSAASPFLPRPLKPGEIHNRDSIKTVSFMTKRGAFSKIFSTSGHGGFLEVGTRFMSPEPYVWPAFQRSLSVLKAGINVSVAEAGLPK